MAMGKSIRSAEGATTEGNLRRFACVSCGKCCDGGPEMELSEATTLAGSFITRVMFKVHSLPLHETGRRAALWRDTHPSDLAMREALAETREHLARFSVRDEIDKSKGRSLHLTISAIAVDLEPGRCPALRGNLCGIYDARPLTCRTLPMHYSRPASSLSGYLSEFVARPGYACNVDPSAPAVLRDHAILDEGVREARSAAYDIQVADDFWKREIVAAMANADSAAACGLPSHELVQRNSDRGIASAVSMLAAWRLAKRGGILSDAAFESVCRDQARLIAAALSGPLGQPVFSDLQAMLLEYEIENSGVNLHPLGPQTRRGSWSASSPALMRRFVR
jgi:Fe-S-cluster containining protein